MNPLDLYIYMVHTRIMIKIDRHFIASDDNNSIRCAAAETIKFIIETLCNVRLNISGTALRVKQSHIKNTRLCTPQCV